MKKYLLMLLFVFLTVLAVACSNDETSNGDANGDWEPEQPIEIVAPAGAGGGWDTTARMAAKVFSEEGIIEEDIGVVNKPGGGGAVGWAYIAGHEGSAHNLFVASPPLILVPLNGQSEYGYDDFTPLANMIADYGAFAVREDAPWNDLNELFEDMKEDPESISVVGTSSPGSMDHIQFVQIAKAAGVDVTKIKYVTDPEGVGLTQLLNGSVEVFSTGVSETIEQVKAGTIKVLGVTAEERLEGEVLEEFPTAIEQGIDATFVNWRGFFGPPNMDEAAVKYYEAKFKELSDSEEFADIRSQYGWNEMYMDSEEYKSFLDEQNEEVQSLLDELGLGE
ncbi:tripartite tricarboxylate transporter substrate binding protein [Ornithinibacillus sp. L9]|uniref:Tripartite tricarboxylate transporter substrate binding protein n=1 Tax=Ornithinibacillus caprae TaxID=2678566 RepID=A0A6N8FKI3_9BACI|nr:tripartite tricarboxylate transporter substrate binding protein [Ornithinibacillus caprae]MUK90160.1 tripartite tricarboxylate transporter substrate binding protein [Ornithinibacillus caprae]